MWLNVRVSARESAAIRARIAFGKTLSAHARYLLICGPRETRRSAALPYALYDDLRRIAVNLAQLLDLPDSGGHHAPVARLHARLSPLLAAHVDRILAREDESEKTETRERAFRLRVTADQHLVIKALADQAGKSVSDYTREMLTKGRVAVRQTRERNFPRLEELKALGVALNNKTHKGNILVETPFGLAPILDGIDALIDILAGAQRP